MRSRQLADPERALEARDEHKLCYRASSIDALSLVDGNWWPLDGSDGPWMVMEDREAEQLGLEFGDRLVFSISGDSEAAL